MMRRFRATLQEKSPHAKSMFKKWNNINHIQQSGATFSKLTETNKLNGAENITLHINKSFSKQVIYL